MNALENALDSDTSRHNVARTDTIDDDGYYTVTLDIPCEISDLANVCGDVEFKKNGGPGRTRTYDQEIMSLLL